MVIDWNQLKESHELAYFRGDLATNSPESYTLDEIHLLFGRTRTRGFD